MSIASDLRTYLLTETDLTTIFEGCVRLGTKRGDDPE